MAHEDSVTPLMQQYYSIKSRYQDAILFFRLGDFYEMFDEDALWASKALGMTLAKRNGTPMCGAPHHACDGYIARILQLGRKVAICEQLNMPEKGLAERDVIEVITPGATLNERALERASSNYLCALGRHKGIYSFAYLDLSTAEFAACSYAKPWQEWLADELVKLEAREAVIQEDLLDDDELAAALKELPLLANRTPAWLFSHEEAFKRLTAQMGALNLKAFGFDEQDAALPAAGALLEYLEQNARSGVPHLKRLQRLELEAGLKVNEEARRNLELTRNMQDGSVRFTLFETLNDCKSPMGARLLRRWIDRPLDGINEIEERLGRVQSLVGNTELLYALRGRLAGVQDIERLASRIAMDKAHAKDLIALKHSLRALLACAALLEEAFALPPAELAALQKAEEALERALLEEPSLTLNEGKLIKEGFHAPLDRLKALAGNSMEALEAYAAQERAASGVNLRLKENRVIGLYFETNKAQAELLPPYFIRRQSMASGERFTTEKLMAMQTEIAGAREHAVQLERELFLAEREKLKGCVELLLKAAFQLAVWDVSASFAACALQRGYCRPQLAEEPGIDLRAARHPTVEKALAAQGGYVANDTVIESAQPFLLITGPNMAGKSTYLRTAALIVFMAQIGSFVPASSARIGIVDRLFCRVGAGDNLAKGESTFLTEMSETARILRGATKRSLIIMDEVGRGTGSDDGLAIAWAVLEHIANKIGALTLFATHYHELTAIENPRLRNFSLKASEKNGKIYFLRQIQEGPAEGSYGIHVARLAGVPDEVADAAQAKLQILLQLRAGPAPSFSTRESGTKLNENGAKLSENGTNSPQKSAKLRLFPQEELAFNALMSFNIESSTPLEALNFIGQLQKELRPKGGQS